jgi:hypothetical protein
MKTFEVLRFTRDEVYLIKILSIGGGHISAVTERWAKKFNRSSPGVISVSGLYIYEC